MPPSWGFQLASQLLIGLLQLASIEQNLSAIANANSRLACLFLNIGFVLSIPVGQGFWKSWHLEQGSQIRAPFWTHSLLS